MREREQYRRDSERRIEEIKQREKLRRANEQSSAAREQAQQAQASADEANVRLEQLESRLDAQARRMNESIPLETYPGVLARRLQDGGVSASINGSAMRFDNPSAYNQYVAGLEADRKQRAAEDERRRVEYENGVNAARDRAFKKYPVFADDNSLERLALDSYVTRFLNNEANKPYFQDSSWPEKIADQFAEAYRIGPNGRK